MPKTRINPKIELMRNLMYNEVGKSWSACYRKSQVFIEKEFKRDYPFAYAKILNNEIATIEDMQRGVS